MSQQDKQQIRQNRLQIKNRLKNSISVDPNLNGPDNNGNQGSISEKFKQKMGQIFSAEYKTDFSAFSSSIFVGKQFLSDFEIFEKIGAGAQSVVYKCKEISSGVAYAAKAIKFSTSQSLQDILETFLIMKSLDHDNILKTKVLYIELEKNISYIVSQLCSCDDLRAYMNDLSKKNEKKICLKAVSQIAEQLISALDYLKYKQICHRDLKPENILFNPETQELKIVDFSIAAIKTGDEQMDLWSNTGSIFYRAPETFGESYDERVDIWAAGIIIYELLFGRVPFFHEYSAEAKQKILSDQLQLGDLPEQCKDFMKKILNKNRVDRLTPSDALNHEFLTEARRSKIRKISTDQTRNSCPSSRISQNSD